MYNLPREEGEDARMTQKIVPHLWFDKEAVEAAKFYCSVFRSSELTSVTTLHGTPSGDCDLVSFNLSGYEFMSISAGPLFQLNPSVSFMLNFDPSKDKGAQQYLDDSWGKMLPGAKVLMEIGEYPFSKRYGWLQDKFGVSWQFMLTDPSGTYRPFITPSLLFTGSVCGKAEEATDFYISTFKDSKRGFIARYPSGMEPDQEGTIMFTDFMLEKQWFAAMDSAHEHAFAFNEAISFLVRCDSQEEIDYYWKKLSAVPESEQCGWLKDRYGVSWQITPAIMGEMFRKGTPEQIDRLTQAFLPMKKLDIAALQAAYNS
jgi:predicted 3-demethylubiquinone-9 3-methyltransferase (glyoxalase superfamily)